MPRRVQAPTPVYAHRASCAHRTSNTILTHMLTCVAQICPDSWGSVRTGRARVARLNLNREIYILLRAYRGWALRPSVETAASETRHTTHCRDYEHGLVIPHEFEGSLDGFGIVPVSLGNLRNSRRGF